MTENTPDATVDSVFGGYEIELYDAEADAVSKHVCMSLDEAMERIRAHLLSVEKREESHQEAEAAMRGKRGRRS